MNDETSLATSRIFTVKRVTKANRSEFSKVLQEAAEALEQQRQPLWSRNELEPEALRHAYPNSEMYLGTQEEKAAAGMILLEEDPTFWPYAQVGGSLFVHKLAVVPSAQGTGVATRMLAFARTLAQGRGKSYLRLDTAAERPKLRAFYEKHGFSCVDERKVGQFDVALYEQRVD